MTEVERKVVDAWRQAAAELGFQFTSPATIILADGGKLEVLGLVHKFGRRIGTIISVINEPSSRLSFRANSDYYTSQLAESYSVYNRKYFIDTLNDWQFFGPETVRPSWYSGSSWS